MYFAPRFFKQWVGRESGKWKYGYFYYYSNHPQNTGVLFSIFYAKADSFYTSPFLVPFILSKSLAQFSHPTHGLWCQNESLLRKKAVLGAHLYNSPRNQHKSPWPADWENPAPVFPSSPFHANCKSLFPSMARESVRAKSFNDAAINLDFFSSFYNLSQGLSIQHRLA